MSPQTIDAWTALSYLIIPFSTTHITLYYMLITVEKKETSVLFVVTGGTGLIGRALSAGFIEDGHEIVILT